MPKASALRFHQSNGSRPNGAPLALRKHSRVLRHRRAPADCFGANPVASALGNPTRRDPGGAMRTYHEGRPAALNTGTFYFGGNRNFLLWSDTGCRAFFRSVAFRTCFVLYCPFGGFSPMTQGTVQLVAGILAVV